MSAPKCTSMFGHRFEARYDKSPSPSWPKFNASSLAAAQQVFDATRQITYIHDICTRCGCIIERPTPPTKTEGRAEP